MSNMECRIGKVKFNNPVITASGTFGFGKEYNEFFDINELGGICTKGLTLNGKEGNGGRRILEVTGGLMNSIGLQNPGVKDFCVNYEEYCGGFETNIIANLGGNTIEEYVEGAILLEKSPVDAIEVNISCPNVKEGGIAFGIKSDKAYEVVKKVREVTTKTMIVKLSPSAENIEDMARACESAGADAISLINTVQAMRIDINKRKPIFNNIYAGLSGSAVKPIALALVHRAAKSVSIPVIGMGGISTWEDAIEFIMAGAECVSIGSANFYNPTAALEVLKGIENYMKREGIENLNEIRGII